MDNNEIRNANRKALPKFLLFMGISMVLGGTVGFFSARYGLNTLADDLKTAGKLFGMHLAPWLLAATAVVLPLAALPIYQSAKNLITAWDGEDEDVSDSIDQKLSLILWLTGAAFIISFFLIAATYSGGFAAFENKRDTLQVFVGIIAVFAVLIESVMIQQKCVDAAKKINPEKTASIYDMKFQKKWMDSCDEAEKIMVGKCAFQAYRAANAACSVLAILLAVCALVFETGFLPSLAVCLIWIISHSVYCKEAIKYAKAGNRIS